MVIFRPSGGRLQEKEKHSRTAKEERQRTGKDPTTFPASVNFINLLGAVPSGTAMRVFGWDAPRAAQVWIFCPLNPPRPREVACDFASLPAGLPAICTICFFTLFLRFARSSPLPLLHFDDPLSQNNFRSKLVGHKNTSFIGFKLIPKPSP